MTHFHLSPFASTSLICVLLISIGGCATTGPAAATDEGGVSAAYIGDPNRTGLGEVVVSMRFRGGNGPYQNLHILPAVNITQKRGLSLNSAMSIVRQMESRMAARLTETFGAMGEQSLDDMPALRAAAKAQVQAVMEGAFRQWKEGADYQVEAMIEGMYWTDASVGRSTGWRGW